MARNTNTKKLTTGKRKTTTTTGVRGRVVGTIASKAKSASIRQGNGARAKTGVTATRKRRVAA